MRITNDLIFMKWSYDMKPYFLKKVEWVIWEINWSRTFTGIVDALQCIDMNNRTIETYLFMKYWEAFISEILMSKNDYKKEKNQNKKTKL